VQAGEVGSVGGAAKATLLLCEALGKIGAKVTLFVTLAPDDDVLARLTTRGINVRMPAVRVGWRAALPQRVIALQLWTSARKEKPRLIHVVGLSREAREILRLPKVAPVYVWETTEAQPANKFVDAGVPGFLERAEAVLVPSATIEENVRSTYRYNGAIGRLPYWAEEIATGESHHGGAGPRRKILYFGRLDRDKGFEYLLRAFQSLRVSLPDAELTICGGGDARNIPGLVPAPAGVTVLGRVSSDALDRLIRESDVVVLPSFHEGYPISLLEACARSIPVVATSVGSIPEVFSGRKCALLVPPKDAQSLTRALLMILTEPGETYSERRKDSRRLFEEVSSPAVIEDQLRQAYA
jgi:glycosyltransferase involved in cell wall biosynthesis